jgi:hypothetical protein
MKTNWVCFDCRHIARLGYVKLARCPRCQQPLQILAARLGQRQLEFPSNDN